MRAILIVDGVRRAAKRQADASAPAMRTIHVPEASYAPPMDPASLLQNVKRQQIADLLGRAEKVPGDALMVQPATMMGIVSAIECAVPHRHAV